MAVAHYVLLKVSPRYPQKHDRIDLDVSCCCHRECLALKPAAGGAASAPLPQSGDRYSSGWLMKAVVALPRETLNSGKEQLGPSPIYGSSCFPQYSLRCQIS